MEKTLEKKIREKTQELIAAESVCPDAKKAAERYLKALKEGKEERERAAFLKELKEDLTPIDGLLAFANSSKAAQCFGEDKVQAFRKHCQDLKASGARYCDCPACQAAASLIELLQKA
jgi:hypothetical protein